MSWGLLHWVYPVWDSVVFLDLGDYVLTHFREVSNYYLLKYFLMVFLFVFFFWDSYDSNVGCFTLSQKSLRLSLFLLILFSFFLSVSLISTILSSPSLILSSAFCYSTVGSLQSVFYLIYCIIISFLFLLGPC